MHNKEDASVPVCVYRLVAGTTTTIWQIVAKRELAQAAWNSMNSYDPEGGWQLESLEAKVPLYHIGPLIGYLCGSQTGGQKAQVARQNGKKGGRPKKPINGLFDPQSPLKTTGNMKEVIEANLPPL